MKIMQPCAIIYVYPNGKVFVLEKEKHQPIFLHLNQEKDDKAERYKRKLK